MDSDLSLKELRYKYPKIKSNSKKIFLEKIKEKPTDDISIDKAIMYIREHFNKGLLKKMHILTDCECVIEGYQHFINEDFKIDEPMYIAIVDAYNIHFRPRKKYSACCKSVRDNTREELRAYYKKLITRAKIFINENN